DLWTAIEALDGSVDAQIQVTMLLRTRTLLERGTRWLLRNSPRPLGIAPSIERFRPTAAVLAEALPGLLSPAQRAAADAAIAGFADAGVPVELAGRVAHLRPLFSTLDIVEIALEAGLDAQEIAGVYFLVGDALELQTLHDRIAALPRGERWEALARRALWEDL